MRILTLGGNAAAACAIVQSLGARGHAAWLAGPDRRSPAFSSRHVVAGLAYPDPLVDSSAFQEWVLAQQRRHRFALIIPATEETLLPLHALRAHPELDGAVALPPAAAVEIAFDKERVRQLAGSIGIASPDTLLCRSVADLTAPRVGAWLAEGAVVVKPVRSRAWNGSKGRALAVGLATDALEARRLVERALSHGPAQVQRWVPGHGVGIELLADRGEIVLSFAHERLHELPLTGGGSSYRRSIDAPPELLDAAARLSRALDWHGVAMVEFRVDQVTGRHWMMELNGRFWGSLALAQFAGVDFPGALVDLLVDGRRPVLPRPRTAVYARRLRRDIEWTRAVLRARKQNGANRFLLTRPIAATLLEWTRLASGREVWDGARFDDPAPILHEVAQTIRETLDGGRRAVHRRVLHARAGIETRWRIGHLAGTRRVLILCTGNICRSAYAAVRLRRLAPGVEIRSAGLLPIAGRPSPGPFRQAALARRIDLAAHRSSSLLTSDLEWAERVVIMDGRNHADLAAIDPRRAAAALWLGALDDGPLEVADPEELSPAATERVLARIDRCVLVLAGSLTPFLRQRPEEAASVRAQPLP